MAFHRHETRPESDRPHRFLCLCKRMSQYSALCTLKREWASTLLYTHSREKESVLCSTHTRERVSTLLYTHSREWVSTLFFTQSRENESALCSTHTQENESVLCSTHTQQRRRKQNWSGQATEARCLWSEWVTLLCCAQQQFKQTATAVSLISLLAQQYTLQGIPIAITRTIAYAISDCYKAHSPPDSRFCFYSSRFLRLCYCYIWIVHYSHINRNLIRYILNHLSSLVKEAQPLRTGEVSPNGEDSPVLRGWWRKLKLL